MTPNTHLQHCSIPDCPETWHSRKPQSNFILYCHYHQALHRIHNPISPVAHDLVLGAINAEVSSPDQQH